MFNSNFISISDNSIYFDSVSFSCPLLSKYLLDIYLKEIDDYVFKLCLNSYDNKIFSFAKLTYGSLVSVSSKVKDYIPNRLEIYLNKSKRISSVSGGKFSLLIDNLNKVLVTTAHFEKRVSFTRYLDFFLFGFLMDIFSTRHVFRKYLSFIRSNIHFDIESTKIAILKDKTILFLGFQIKIMKKVRNNPITFHTMKVDKVFVAQMLSRIKFYKKKNIRVLINRINFEVLLHLNYIVTSKISKGIFLQKKLWLFVFQQEAIRSSRVGKLPSNSDNIKSMSKFFKIELKKLYLGKHLVYFFDSYLLKMQFLIGEVLKGFQYNSDFQMVPFDVSFSKFFIEYEKYLFFFYNDIFFKNPYQPVGIFL